MAGHNQPYDEYKASGIEWVGSIPLKWDTSRFKYRVTLVAEKATNKTNPVGLENIKGWTGEFISSDAEFQGEGVTFRAGDILFGKLRPYLAKVFLADGGGEAVGDFLVFRPNNLVGRFLQYLMLTQGYISIVDGSTYGAKMPRASWAFMADMKIPCPSSDEQIQIANFLDHETAKIDTLIDKQQQLIKLLKEKRQAVISHAVTKGLNPDAPMKDSGVEWLGEVPEHWRVTRLKYHTTLFEQGWSPQCDTRFAEGDEFGVLKVGCVNGGNFKSTENKALPVTFSPQIKYALKKNDLLISRANTKDLVGSAAVVDQNHDRLLLCDKLYRLRFDQFISPQFVSYYLSSPAVRQKIELGASGASHSMQNIGQGTIKELYVAVPPATEAAHILCRIGDSVALFDKALNKASQQILLLNERRTALISAAVTGKIDVRNWQPALTDTPTEASA